MTTPLSHIVEPQALLLVWQGSDESDRQKRTRRVVGKITREHGGTSKFKYLLDTQDFRAARDMGFHGYPGFNTSAAEHPSESVMEALMRRLPARKREDFADYLALHRLPNPFLLSDFALLGYTGAMLPSDGFSVVPVFNPDETPCEYILEVAGSRHHCEHVDAAEVGDLVQLQEEPDNPADSNAIAVLHEGRRLGYVNRALIPTVSSWMKNKVVKAVIERKSGKPTHPLIYVRLQIV